MIPLIIRAWSRGKLVATEKTEIAENEMGVAIGKAYGSVLDRLIKKDLMAPDDYMFELELPTAPEHVRFLRFGTNAKRMVMPIAMDLEKE